MLVLALFGRCRVTPKLAIARILFGREDFDLSQVRLEVNFPHPGLKSADLLQLAGQAIWRNRLGSEESVELALLVDEQATGHDRACGHRGEKRMSAGTLLISQLQLRRQLENMRGTCKAVQFSGSGKSHPLAVEKGADFVRRQRLDVTRLLAGVRCRRKSAGGNQCRYEQGK